MVPDENAAVAAALGLARDAESATQWPQAVDAALTWLHAAAADALEVRYCSTEAGKYFEKVSSFRCPCTCPGCNEVEHLLTFRLLSLSITINSPGMGFPFACGSGWKKSARSHPCGRSELLGCLWPWR